MINFLSQEYAQAAFGHSQSEYGAQFATKVATINYFNEVREWAKNSATARELLKYVEDADEEINFIGMYGGFQCFDESADNKRTGRGEPTIYIDLRGKLSVYIRKPHENVLSRSMTQNAAMSPFNNKIALLHELGHSKQFIERPEWYRFHANKKKQADFRMELETKAKKLWVAKFTAQNKPAPVPQAASGNGPPPPPPPGGNAGPSPQKLAQELLPKSTERAKDQKWFVVIDVDNMSRHEWPICQELGQPVRMHYTDLSA